MSECKVCKGRESAGSAARFGQHIEIPEGALVFKDTEETLKIDYDDEPMYSTKQWNELQAKLEAAEKERSESMKNLMEEHNELIAVQTELMKSDLQCIEIEQQRDDLQRQVSEQSATIAQMREALQKAMNHLVRYAKQSDTGLLYQICRQAVDTPPTAYEQKVQGLVGALDAINKWSLVGPLSSEQGRQLVAICDTAQQALAAFMGGEK